MWLYTNAPREFRGAGDLPLFHVNMDTWYYSEWADSNHRALLGTLALGDAPLAPAQGVAAFVARQVTAFLDAFSGVFHPVAVRVWYKPRLSGVVHHAFDFPAPETSKDVQAIQTTLEQAADTYEGITSLDIEFALRATVRDENGQLAQIWLPDAGEASYHAHYSDGYVSNLPRSVAVTYVLTPLAQEGIAPWAVNLECNYMSLFRESNNDVLTRVRSQWQRWLQTHPTNSPLDDEDDDAVGDSEGWKEDYIVTLAVPPPGMPPDNRELYERNTPRVHAAVARWEERLGTAFEWAVLP